MGLFSAIRERQEQQQRKEWLQMMKPYVLIPFKGEILWWHWEIVPTTEETLGSPKHGGLPVLMTKEECAAVNGGNLPDYWGETPYAWRSKEQKQAFYLNYPELFARQQKGNEDIGQPQANEVRATTPRQPSQTQSIIAAKKGSNDRNARNFLDVVGVVSRWVLTGVAVVSFFMFIALLGSSSQHASELAGQALGRAIICGIISGVWFYGARQKSKDLSAPKETVTPQAPARPYVGKANNVLQASSNPADVIGAVLAQPSSSAAKRDVTREELMELVKQSLTRELTDKEVTILTDRLSWRDEATRAQWYREQGDLPTEAQATNKMGQHKLPE